MAPGLFHLPQVRLKTIHHSLSFNVVSLAELASMSSYSSPCNAPHNHVDGRFDDTKRVILDRHMMNWEEDPESFLLQVRTKRIGMRHQEGSRQVVCGNSPLQNSSGYLPLLQCNVPHTFTINWRYVVFYVWVTDFAFVPVVVLVPCISEVPTLLEGNHKMRVSHQI